MSEEKGPARPRQVTMGAVMGVISSVVLVLGLFDTLGRLRTPAMREVVGEFLAQAPGSSLGLDTAQVVDWMRGLAFVSGALAAMGMVFAIFVLQRHRGARVGFTVVAVLLLLTVPVAGLMPFFFAVSAFLLWSQPARDWYAGKAPAPVSAGTGSTRADGWTAPVPDLEQEEQPVSGSSPSHDQPPVTPAQPYGQPFGQQPQSYGQAPYPAQGYPGQQQVRDPGKRPTTVTVAALLTWIGAGATALLMLVFVAVLGTGGDAFVEEFQRAARQSDVTLGSDEVLAVGWAIAGTMLVWSLISIVLAVFAFRRSNGARIALLVSAVMAALFSLIAIMSILSIVTLLLAGATAILLFTGGANQWYSRRSSNDHPSGPPPGLPYAGYPQPNQPSPPPQAPPRNQPW